MSGDETRHCADLNRLSLFPISYCNKNPRPNISSLTPTSNFTTHLQTRETIAPASVVTMSIISSSPPSQPSTSLPVDESISAAQWLITKWRYNRVSATSPPSFLFLTNSQEAKEYIKCVHELHRIMEFFVSTHSESPNIALAHNLIQSAMQRLEMEFHHLLSINSDGVSMSSEEGDCDTLSNTFADDLKMIAHCMIRAGYGIECARAYKSVRKRAVDDELVNLGFQKLKSLKVNKGMRDGELDRRVRTWIRAMFLTVGRVFRGERILCDHIFSGASDALGESSFAEATLEGIINIFKTGEMVTNAKGKSSTDRIFRLMEMHIAIQEVIPEIESIFSFESTSVVHAQALKSLTKLRNSIHLLFYDFESNLKKQSTKLVATGGGIHPLTQSTMDHIARLADYSAVLSSIITDHPSPADDKTWMPESYLYTTAAMESPISIRFARLILVLLCKLDKIAENHKDISLSYLFLANNLHFVIQKVRCTSNLLTLIGEGWVISHHRISMQYASKYEFTAWHKVIKSIDLQEISLLSTKAAKERIWKFKSSFEEAIRKQRSWTVVDERVREDLKASIARRVVSAYVEYLDEHDAEIPVNLTPADLEIGISDLFRGVPASQNLSSSSSSSSSSSASASAASPSSSSSPKLGFFNRLPNKKGAKR